MSTKNLKLIFVTMFCALGAILLAPTAKAVDNDSAVSAFQTGIDYVNDSYSTNISDENYYVFGGYRTMWDNSHYVDLYLIPKDSNPFNVVINDYGNAVELRFTWLSLSYAYYVRYYVDNPNNTNITASVITSPYYPLIDFDIRYTERVIYTNCGDIVDNSTATISYISMVTQLDNVNFVNFDNMLTTYLDDKGFNVTSAFFADEHGQAVYTLPIVTSYQDLPIDYNGMFLQDLSTDYYYRYRVGIMPTSTPSDFQDYWDKYVVVQFNTGTFTEANILLANAYNVYPSTKLFETTTYNAFKPYTLTVNELNLRGVVIPFQTVTNNSVNVGTLWRYEDTSIAIPRIITSDFYIAFNYKNMVTDDVTGETTDTAGIDSNTYNNYTTNYYQQKQNELYATLTGTFDPTGFSGDFRGQSVDTTIAYDNDTTIDDAGMTNFFQRIWTVGDGYFTTVLLSVLGIAFAAYLIYGRSG